jgi:hypothetical protein
MTIFRLPRRLTLLAWETQFVPEADPLTVNVPWSRRAGVDGLTLDFTQVEFAEFGALARALLLLDDAVRHQVPATVTLPSLTLTASENQHIRQSRAAGRHQEAEDVLLAHRVRARGDALAFMRQVGFLDSLSAPHWSAGAVRVLDSEISADLEQPSDAIPGDATPDPDPRDAPYRRRRVFPLRWLEPLQGEMLRESESFLAVTEGLRDLGLSVLDARAVSQTVLSELVENVAGHREPKDEEPPRSLVGAILLSAETYALRQQGMAAQLGELADYAMANGSHVLGLIVADSTAVLVTHAEPTHGQGGAASGREPVDRTSRTGDSILRAFDKWAPSGQSIQLGQHSPGSLWRVARMVRSYRGSVVVRTADTMAGLLFGRAADGAGIVERGLGYAPGTLLEVSILTDHPRALPQTSWEYHTDEDDQTRLRWLNCGLDPLRGLSDVDSARLEKAARDAHRDPAASGVVMSLSAREVDWYQTDHAMRGAMRAVLDTASRIANPAAVVVLCPDADPRILDLCVAGFNEESAATDDAGWSSPHSPVLVLGSSGSPLWCGGAPSLRAVLTMLSGAGGSLATAAARRRWHEAGGDPEEFWRALRDQDQLVRTGDEQLALRVSPSTVQATLEASVDSELSAVIRQGGAGVRVGLFRGPALRVTNRWVDVEQLLAETIGTQMASYVLARKVDAVIRSSGQPRLPTAAVQVASASREFVRQFSECIALGGRYYFLPAELDIGDLPVGERIPRGATVVLCADIVSTENTVRRAAAGVAGGDADPLIIACLVDARNENGPIRLLNREIQVVSLTRAHMAADDPVFDSEPIIDIDPFLLRPHVPVPAAEPPVLETDLLEWCAADPDILRLGHVEYPPNRHFSAVIRLDHALRQREIRYKITDAILATAQGAFADIAGAGNTVDLAAVELDIWHVESRDGNARRLADAVHKRLVSRGGRVIARIPVSRGIAGDTWAFPNTLNHGGGTRPSVVIGWSSVTGATLLQTTRLAASSGASHVVAVSMLNQLNGHDAEALGMLRAVSASTAGAQAAGQPGADTAAARDLAIPVAIRFVTVSSITALAAHDCAICATEERYEVSGEAAPLRLHRHAERLREMLRPRGAEEVSRDAAADLFTVPISGDEVVDYLRWRGLLLRALRDLGARQELVDRLGMLTQARSATVWTRPGLIRLLAAEQQWLKLPPLRFTIARELLATACIGGLEQATTAPPWLRVQALIVLCATVPERLTELLPRLLAHVADEAVLVDQLFLDCYRLMLRPPRDSPIDVQQLRRNLVQCRDYLEQAREKRDTRLIDDYLHIVKELITIADYRIIRKPTDARAAWERLREDLVRPVIRHGLESDVLLVRSFVEDLEEVEPTAESARAARADWDICARQLQERALANLPALRDIISGEYVSDALGRREQHRLLSLAQADVMELRAVADRLDRLTREPWRPDYPPWQALRRELLDRINWWNRVFLAAHVPDYHASALLVDLVRSAPVWLGPRVSSVLAAHGAEARIDDPAQGEVLVFCPEKLLDQVVGHLADNVQRHCSLGAVCKMNIRYEQLDSEHIRLVMRNSGSKPSRPPGQGIKALNDKLRPFGGDLVGRILTKDEWTFEAIATLSLWNRG